MKITIVITPALGETFDPDLAPYVAGKVMGAVRSTCRDGLREGWPSATVETTIAMSAGTITAKVTR